MKTLLLSMPFGAVDRPALGISLLKAGLAAKGFTCDVAYPFEFLIRRIGLTDYKWLTDGVPYTSFAGDWCFTLPLYGRRPDQDWAYVSRILRDEWTMSVRDIRRVLRAREATADFLQDCLSAYDWNRYDVVGFTSTFVQNLASLAFARLLKETHPHLTIVFGGANWEDEMGRALFARFDFVDYVCQGEADESFPALIAALSRGDRGPAISGVLHRHGPTLPAQPVTRMDDLAYPDFSDFFAAHDRAARSEAPLLLMETSRGCWWGAKHHCTFCGLNGQGMGFRSKSPDRALAELTYLTERHDAAVVSMVDNILDMRYFETMLPRLAEAPGAPVLFYETKANLSRKQVGQLAAAKVLTIQPGIESLSNRVLSLMRKGTTGLRNIQLLKWCREMGVSVEWNVLYGFPGETDDDYAPMLETMPLLAHLQPPSGFGPVRVDRFSPYFKTPEAFGLTALRPLPVFEYLYPFDTDTRRRIACYFEADYAASRASGQTVARLGAAIGGWKAAADSLLRVEDRNGCLRITDTRSGRNARYELEGVDRLIYLACDRITSVSAIAETLERLGEGTYPAEAIEEFLGRLAEAGLILSDEGQHLALGVHARFPEGWDRAAPQAIAAE